MESAVRRSANYMPTIWKDAYIQSLNSPYGEKRFLERAEKLKGEVKIFLGRRDNLHSQIEYVDLLERLGINYQFTEYIDTVLKNIYQLVIDGGERDSHNLHAVALRFRLLRQHGYNVSPEVFRNFMDENGEFKMSLSDDTKGLMSLYEASYLLMEGEPILESAQAFATHHLHQKLKRNKSDNIAEEIGHALELPFHWRMLRLESRWFIDAYEMRQDMNPLLLDFAKLDFNIVQAMYLDELKELSRWYTKSGLAERLNFARDRLVENFYWTIGYTYEPCFSYCRIVCAKIAVLITMIDDVYDVYGTLSELELFTGIVERWDVNNLDKLPDYMKICFLALFNTINEMGYDMLRDKGCNIIPHSTYRWVELFKKYLVEANWYHSEYKPSLDEFLNIAWVSSPGPIFAIHAYLCMTNPIKDKPLEEIKNHPEIIKWPSLISRFANDMGNSSYELKRGDTPKSIQCYMRETGCGEEDARGHIKNLIASTWKKVNKDTLMNGGAYSRDFIKTCINFARISQCVYQYGDGHGVQDREMKSQILKLVMEPIPLH